MIWNLLIVLSIIILIASLRPVRRLIALVPNSMLRNSWRGLLGMILLFIVGFAIYGILFWHHHLFNEIHDHVVPLVFLSGSLFVWFTTTLFLRTTTDLRRMALLEEENITDALTGIYNRRYLDRRLANEVARAKRYGRPLSVLMIDIDHFKRVNDLHGHHAGDLALSYLGKLLLDAVRSPDVVARYGGEEIVIVAPDSVEHEATRLAERLRERVAEHELILSSEGGGQKSVRLTISIGVAELSREIKTGNELIDCADKALYAAKEHGRNRVAPFSHLDT
jgi:diguanylate cyclase (GGDEF)-like protein